MSKIRVRIEIEASGLGLEQSAAMYPVSLAWDQEFTSTGDNPRFYGSQLQAAVRKAAERAIRNMQPYCEFVGEVQP